MDAEELIAKTMPLPSGWRVARAEVRDGEKVVDIVNAVVHRVTNASSESINARVQALKKRANGYRNRERFRNAIYFHL